MSDDPLLIGEQLLNELRAERDVLAAQVAALAEGLRKIVRIYEDSSLTNARAQNATIGVAETLLADVPAAGRALLAERDELRARLANAEANMATLDRLLGAVTERGKRAETALRGAADVLEEIGAWFIETRPTVTKTFENRIVSAVTDVYAALSAAAAPEEERTDG